MSLKAQLKDSIGSLCECSLLQPYLVRGASRLVNVIYYHHVGIPDPHYQAFYAGCSLQKFQRDLECLGRIYDFVSLDEVIAKANDADCQKRPLMTLTFDDGFDLHKCGVVEILRRMGIAATTFVITSCLGNERLMWRHALSAIQTLVPASRWRAAYDRMADSFGLSPMAGARSLIVASNSWDMRRKDELAGWLWRHCDLPPLEAYLEDVKPYFTMDGLRRWQSEGHSIGFHTHTHPYSSRLGRDDLAEEIILPASRLQERFGIGKPLCLSYPFGDRLRGELEHELFSKGIFRAFFGIRGFSRRGSSPQAFERAGMEAFRLGWSVFASTAVRTNPF